MDTQYYTMRDALQELIDRFFGPEDEPDDQTAKADSGKPKLTLVPRKPIYGMARVREFGTNKYGDPENWRKVSVERYRDAAFRHWLAYLDDPYGVDAESGLPHLWHAMTDMGFIVELEWEQYEIHDEYLEGV